MSGLKLNNLSYKSSKGKEASYDFINFRRYG
jgi:hypothetical protein